MYQILKAEKLADKIYLMEVEAPRVARSCEPGEFVIVRIDEEGERIPLTICDYDREQGTVTIVFQTVGASTERMALLKEGDTFRDFVGPLGNPSDFVKEDPEELKKKRILYVAGGVGTAPVYPQVKWLKEHGVKVDGHEVEEVLLVAARDGVDRLVAEGHGVEIGLHGALQHQHAENGYSPLRRLPLHSALQQPQLSDRYPFP